MSPLRYDDDSLFGAARNSDPATAKDAAKSMTAPILNRQRRKVLARVETADWVGFTAYNVACLERMQQNIAARRLTDLKEMGMVEERGTRLGGSGRLCTVYRITDAGREALR